MRSSIAFAAAALLLPAVHAQEARNQAPPSYKVDFNIQDTTGGSARPARHYTLLTEPGRKATFKIGNRVPVASGSFQPGTGGVGINPLVNTQYTYLDVGVSIEFSLNEGGGRIALRGTLDLSNVQRDGAGGVPNPTVVQTKVDLGTELDTGKPTVIAAIDDPVDARKFQLEVTVTRLN